MATDAAVTCAHCGQVRNVTIEPWKQPGRFDWRLVRCRYCEGLYPEDREGCPHCHWADHPCDAVPKNPSLRIPKSPRSVIIREAAPDASQEESAPPSEPITTRGDIPSSRPTRKLPPEAGVYGVSTAPAATHAPSGKKTP